MGGSILHAAAWWKLPPWCAILPYIMEYSSVEAHKRCWLAHGFMAILPCIMPRDASNERSIIQSKWQPKWMRSTAVLVTNLDCPAAKRYSHVGPVARCRGSKLVSRNGKFALGFFQPAAGTISKSQNTSGSSWYLEYGSTRYSFYCRVGCQ
ncbi:putative serine/threonine-protein kinase receptor [Hordeum vulgare]|nr:putative serine/threonine-protein kinase receptor [Hordeum vulgare]